MQNAILVSESPEIFEGFSLRSRMKNVYLSIDIGASSGRHILGWLEGGKIRLEEVYRFPNGMVNRGGHLCWDVDVRP